MMFMACIYTAHTEPHFIARFALCTHVAVNVAVNLHLNIGVSKVSIQKLVFMISDVHLDKH